MHVSDIKCSAREFYDGLARQVFSRARANEVKSFVMHKQSIETSTLCSLCNIASVVQREKIFIDRVKTRD